MGWHAGYFCSCLSLDTPCSSLRSSLDGLFDCGALIESLVPALQVLEKARQDRFLGSSLEANVLLYVQDESLREALKTWNRQPNTADPLRFMFIVSQVGYSDSNVPTPKNHLSVCSHINGSLIGLFGLSFPRHQSWHAFVLHF